MALNLIDITNGAGSHYVLPFTHEIKRYYFDLFHMKLEYKVGDERSNTGKQ